MKDPAVIYLIADTIVRRVCFEGEPAWIALVSRPSSRQWMIHHVLQACDRLGCPRPVTNYSAGYANLKWGASRSQACWFPSDVPHKLRGPQHHLAWLHCDGACPQDTVDNLRFGLRLGDYPFLIET